MPESDKAKKILRKPYTRQLTPEEDGGYVAKIMEFPGCIAEGDTSEEALHNLESAAESWLTVALHNKYEVREPVSFLGVSGKIALRIPRGLHRQVAELAEHEGCSVNQLLTNAVAQYVSGKTVANQLTGALSVNWTINNVMHVQTPATHAVINDGDRLFISRSVIGAGLLTPVSSGGYPAIEGVAALTHDDDNKPN